MSRPRVTVVLPTHERAAFVRRAVDSLLAQSFGDWELEAVDDGSSDGTADILAELAAADARVRATRHATNRGLGAALNTGIAQARGELIAYLPDDDVWYPDLSPSAELVAKAQAAQTPAEWSAFVRAFRAEMSHPAPSRSLDLLAALSKAADFSVGCYCEEESHCHRSVLRELLAERGAAIG